MIKGTITRDFDLKGLEKRTLKEIDNALIYVGYRVINDVDDVGPKVPIDEGTLVGSSYVSVEGVDGLFNENYIANDQAFSGDKSLITTPDTNGMKKQSMRISYNTAYAQKIHEEYKDMFPGIASRQKFGITEEGRQEKYGYKFLERTYKDNEQKYIQLFKEFIEDGIKRA